MPQELIEVAQHPSTRKGARRATDQALSLRDRRPSPPEPSATGGCQGCRCRAEHGGGRRGRRRRTLLQEPDRQRRCASGCHRAEHGGSEEHAHPDATPSSRVQVLLGDPVELFANQRSQLRDERLQRLAPGNAGNAGNAGGHPGTPVRLLRRRSAGLSARPPADRADGSTPGRFSSLRARAAMPHPRAQDGAAGRSATSRCRPSGRMPLSTRARGHRVPGTAGPVRFRRPPGPGRGCCPRCL